MKPDASPINVPMNADRLNATVERERARLFFSSQLYGSLTAAAVGFLYWLILIQAYGTGRPTLWLALLLSIVALRIGLSVYTRRVETAWTKGRRFLMLAVLGSLLNGVVWGLGSVWFPPGTGPLESTVMQVLLLAGVPAGALGSLAIYWPAYLAYSGSGLLIYAADLALGETSSGAGSVLAIAVLAYLALMLVIAWGFQRTILESLRYRFAADDLAERLRRALDDAESGSRAKSQFLANMSHEIRTPLNGVLGMADLLQGTALDQAQQRYCNAIVASGSSLRDLLGDILDLSKVEAGKVELERQDFDLAALLADLVVAFRELMVARGNALHTDFDLPARALYRGDALRLRQVLTNLLGNATKFTENGRIELSAQALEPRPGDSRQWLRIRVMDNGIGMNSGTLAKLFRPFEQADSSTTREYGGTGLGLAIAKHLIVLMGGTLEVMSTPWVSTEFRLEIPLDAAHAAPSPDSAPAAVTASGAMLAILVVEDNEINQMVARAMLEGAGHCVEVAVDGAEAVRKCAQSRFDCVLMDCQMPVMDGFEATQIIHAREAGKGHARTPVIALTANTMAGDRERCLAAGMDNFLSKPFDRASLLAAVARARSSYSPGRQ